MSVIAIKVGKNKVTVAADSIVVRYGHLKGKASKISKHGDLVIGTVGLAETGALLRLYAQSHKPRSGGEFEIMTWLADFSGWAEDHAKGATLSFDDFEYVVVFKGNAWHGHGFYLERIVRHAAMGAGAEMALGAMAVGASARQAIRAALSTSIFTTGPVEVIKVSTR